MFLPPATEFTPVSALAGGVLIGISAVYLMYFSGRIAGISGMVRRLLPPWEGGTPPSSSAFLAGLVIVPVGWIAFTGGQIAQSISPSIPLALASGVLVGFGAVFGGGCTSGHGVCGLARFSKRSLAAVAVFMTTAAITVYVARHVVGA